MMPRPMTDEELREECEVKKKVIERGYAFVEIQLADGDWAIIDCCRSYKSAQNRINRMQADMMRRNHRIYHFRIQ